MLETLLEKFRSGLWLLAALAMAFAVGWVYPSNIVVLLWLLAKLALAAGLGWWIDRTVFHYARPRVLFYGADRWSAIDNLEGARELRRQGSLAALRRAIIMACMVIALALLGGVT